MGKIADAQRMGVYVGDHKLTVAEFGDRWVSSQIHQRASTAAQMESRWRLHIRPTLGHMGLPEVTRAHIQAAVQKWAREMRPATVGVVYGYVSALFKAAVEDRLLAHSPCTRGVNLPRAEHQRVVPLTVAQVHQIAERITPRYRGLILLGAASGMRSGELRGLTSDRLTFNDDGTATVRIDRQLVTTTPTWGPPKTSRSDRTLTIDPESAQALWKHRLAYPSHESGLVFTGREGGPLARTSIATAWDTATRGMDLPDRSGLHALRHFHASLLIAAGLSVTAVADRLGHQDATQVLQVYAHLWPTDEDRSVKAIAAQLWP
jgi:integrase